MKAALAAVLALSSYRQALGVTYDPGNSCAKLVPGSTTEKYVCNQSGSMPCCSTNGWCGSTTAYCGTGCQAAYGRCGTAPPTPVPAPTSKPVAAPVAPISGTYDQAGSCGGAAPTGGKYICNPNSSIPCCSQYGWCGNTADHCTTGCQALYGLCGTSAMNRPTPAPAPIATVTFDPTVTSSKVLTTCVQPGMLALTFDDGTWIYNQQIRDVLNKRGVKATFFINGNNWNYIEDDPMNTEVQLMYNEGHQIASHTWSHAFINKISQAELIEEMCKLDVAIQRAIGRSPLIMRPPYGECLDNTLATLNGWGYTAVNWGLDSFDWENQNDVQSLAYYKAALANADPTKGSFIALNHEAIQSTGTQLVTEVLDYVASLNKGWKWVTVAQCLGKPAYRQSPWNAGTFPKCSCNSGTICF